MSPKNAPSDEDLHFEVEDYDDNDPEALGKKKARSSEKRKTRRARAADAAQALLERCKAMRSSDLRSELPSSSPSSLSPSPSPSPSPPIDSSIIPAPLAWELRNLVRERGRLTVLTGAGISAESGIPTFRGKDGYWTVGSKSYQSQDMATRAMFDERPWAVWAFYLYRLGICMKAGPNAAHRAVAGLDRLFDTRFLLVTQNVDGLHPQAGNPLERCFQVHGDIALMRCTKPCTKELYPVPPELATTTAEATVSEAVQSRLRCPRCQGLARPHVLWFDECYDEDFYHYDGSLTAALSTDALLVIGSSGTTNLPTRMAMIAAQRGILLIDVNPESNYFGELAASSPRGFALPQVASKALGAILQICESTAKERP